MAMNFGCFSMRWLPPLANIRVSITKRDQDSQQKKKKMNDNAKAWLAALRSGEFEQGNNFLKSGVRYCCLGVACELAERAGVGHAWPGSSPHDLRTSFVPPNVQQWLGIHHEHTFASMNDQGKSFSEIADYAEAHENDHFYGPEPTVVLGELARPENN
jgi:hypothetical protein